MNIKEKREKTQKQDEDDTRYSLPEIKPFSAKWNC